MPFDAAMSNVSRTDVRARELAESGTALALARVEPRVLDLWRRAGTLDALGEDRVFSTVRAAVEVRLRLPPPGATDLVLAGSP